MVLGNFLLQRIGYNMAWHKGWLKHTPTLINYSTTQPWSSQGQGLGNVAY